LVRALAEEAPGAEAVVSAVPYEFWALAEAAALLRVELADAAAEAAPGGAGVLKYPPFLPVELAVAEAEPVVLAAAAVELAGPPAPAVPGGCPPSPGPPLPPAPPKEVA
jgi:hypothetical protein